MCICVCVYVCMCNRNFIVNKVTNGLENKTWGGPIPPHVKSHFLVSDLLVTLIEIVESAAVVSIPLNKK